MNEPTPTPTEPPPMWSLDDTILRMERVADDLWMKSRDRSTSTDERKRLAGKSEGVALAISYLKEAANGGLRSSLEIAAAVEQARGHAFEIDGSFNDGWQACLQYIFDGPVKLADYHDGSAGSTPTPPATAWDQMRSSVPFDGTWPIVDPPACSRCADKGPILFAGSLVACPDCGSPGFKVGRLGGDGE